VAGDSPGLRSPLQGYLAHKKLLPPRILQWAYVWGLAVVLGGGAFSYERGTPVQVSFPGSGALSSSLLLLSLELSDMSLKYEPSSEPLHNSDVRWGVACDSPGSRSDARPLYRL
jgi:hypothetical protein